MSDLQKHVNDEEKKVLEQEKQMGATTKQKQKRKPVKVSEELAARVKQFTKTIEEKLK